MISVDEANSKVKTFTKPLRKFKSILIKSVSYVLAEDVIASIDIPPFRQSAMDGYALNLHDSVLYKLVGEVKAGDKDRLVLNPGEAVRIFTGAAVPATANAVVMQEAVLAKGGTIQVGGLVIRGTNIRPQGEQVKRGDVALEKGTQLTPAAIGFLASLGITTVTVYKKPSIALVTTGSELVAPGKSLDYGQIYESNATMLSSALHSLGFMDVSLYKVEDDYDSTHKLLQNIIPTADVVLITGGISVGDYDFVGKALKALGVEEVFYKVRQKPGKPLFFGKKENTTIFALPGNPAATLSCFYVYVYTTLQILSGHVNFELLKGVKKSTSSFTKKNNRAQFLKAIVHGEEVTLLDGQNSAMLQAFALANALVFVPQEVTYISVGDQVDVIVLPN